MMSHGFLQAPKRGGARQWAQLALVARNFVR